MGRMKWAGALAVCLLSAACAGDDTAEEQELPGAETQAPAGTPAAPAPAEAALESLTATLSETQLTLSKDSVPAGPVTILVRNSGTAPHALRVEGGGENWETDPVAPGTDVSMSLNLTNGQYTVSRAGAAAGQASSTRLRVY